MPQDFCHSLIFHFPFSLHFTPLFVNNKIRRLKICFPLSLKTVFLTTTGGWKFGGFGFAALVDQVAAEEVSSFHYPVS